MAKKVVERIDGILKQIKKTQQRLNSISFEEFNKSDLLPDVISFNLVQIGERMNRLEEIIGIKYPNLPWKEARKMRNIIVHDYDHVDYEKVYHTAIDDLPLLKEGVLKVKDDIKHISESSINTKRLILRPWDDFDADELFELAKEPEIGYWCGWPQHKHIKDSLFILHNFLEVEETYAICLKHTGDIIGCISLKIKDTTDMTDNDDECELGYWIGKPYWNNGYATEASNSLIKHAFDDLNMSKIWIGRYDGNIRSEKVQEKLGFVFHHSRDDVFVPQLKIHRVGHVSVLTKERWLKI